MEKKKETFEELLSELEEISKKLDLEDTTLEESISLFEKGMKISKQCSQMLETAKQKIETISDVGSENNDK